MVELCCVVSDSFSAFFYHPFEDSLCTECYSIERRIPSRLSGNLLSMTEKEYKAERLALEVRELETRKRDAKEDLDQGYVRLKAEFEKDYAKLKTAYERACLKVERGKLFLLEAKSEIEKEF